MRKIGTLLVTIIGCLAAAGALAENGTHEGKAASQRAQAVSGSNSAHSSLLGESAVRKLDIPIEIEKDILGIAENATTFPTLADFYKTLEPSLKTAEERGGNFRTKDGIVYRGFFNNFNFKVGKDGLVIWPKKDSILRGNWAAGNPVLVIPLKARHLMFELSYGGVNSGNTENLTYVTIRHYMGEGKESTKYPYYYMLQGDNKGVLNSIQWTPAIKEIPELSASWNYGATDSDALAILSSLSVLQKIQTGFPMAYRFRE
jgi:hypothetical protein